jgi:hypothetical protein
VTLEETMRLFACPFCRVSLYSPPGDFLRCFLPPGDDLPADPIFIPYWRIKGMIFSCKEFEIGETSIDASVIALKNKPFKPSLGIRPQVMRLKLFSPNTPGSALRYDVPQEAILPNLEEQLGSIIGFNQKAPLFHKAFIGETISMIYSPVYIKEDSVYDAILKTPLNGLHAKDLGASQPIEDKTGWHAKFLPALCPECGWNLTGEGDSIILLCDHCSSAWRMTDRGLERLDFVVLGAEGRTDTYLPFWMIKAQIEGLELANYADLVRLANLPKAIKNEWFDQDFYFWVPAFKVRAELFLRIARLITISQPEERIAERLPGASFYPVTLSENEVTEFLKVLIGDMAMAKRKVFPKLSEITVHLVSSRLTYAPFISQMGELGNIGMRLSINMNALKYGHNL